MYTFQSKYIAIEGAIGAGKTSLVHHLSKKYNARAVLEVVEENPFLTFFYNNIKEYAFRTQIFFLLSRYDQQLKALQQGFFKQLSFFDYMFAKDQIFARLTLSGDELAMYERLYEIVSREIPSPDLIVYLSASTSLLINRIKQRGRSFEQNISIEYMESLNSYYEKYFNNQSNFPHSKLVIINVDQMDFVENYRDLDLICQKIEQKDRE